MRNHMMMSPPKKRRLGLDVDVAEEQSCSPVGSHHHRLKHKSDNSRDSAGDAILASMTNTHLQSPDKLVVMFTLTMLAKIFEEKVEYRSLACHVLGTPFSIVQAMKRHASCPRVQSLGCQSLSFLCSTTGNNDTSHVGGIEVALSAMRQFANDPNIQVAACTYLGRLCSTTFPKNVTEYLLSMVGLGDVLSAMKNHANESLVQGSACFAIKNLLDCQLGNVPPFSVEAIQGVVQAMEHHSNDKELISNACHILYHLAWHSDPEERRNEYRTIIINAVSEIC